MRPATATAKRPTNAQVVKAFIEAIVEVCSPLMSSRERCQEIAKGAVHEGNWNGWSNGALAIISLEDGLPLEWHTPGSFDRCIAIGNIAEAKLGGFPVYIEHINGGVAAVYTC